MTGSVGEDPRRSRYVGGAGPTAAYLMDDPRETTRLVAKVDPAAWAERYLNPDPPGRRVVEVGSGPLHLLAAAADRVSAEVAVGVDVSLSRLTAAAHRPAEPGLLAGVVADAAALPFATGSFDFSYTRFLLEYAHDPRGIVREMARVTRPGGTVMLQDLDGQLVTHHPPDPNLDWAINVVLRSLAGRLDVYAGRKLFGYAHHAGLTDLDVRLESYHLIAGTADAATLDLWTQKLDIAAPAIIQALGPAAARTARDRFFAYLTNPATLTFSTLFTVTGTVPP